MRSIKFFSCITACVILWYSCAYNDLHEPTNDLQINLRWVKAYPAESARDITIGVAWTLSYLGATLPEGSLERSMRRQGKNFFMLDLAQSGFNHDAEEAFRQLLVVLKSSDEYRIHGSLDLGRFVMLTLNSVNHYYAITGAKKTLSIFRSPYSFDDRKVGIIHSSIAFGNRVIEISKADRYEQVAFVGIEGEGILANNTFNGVEYEAMDYMPNGQLRFALYDSDGNLKTSASPSLTLAGKPAKCLWCHEISLLPPFEADHELTGYYSTLEFKSILAHRTTLVDEHRKKLASDIDFTKTQDHTKMELLYLSFMEPSAERLALEWGLTVEDVRTRLSGFQTHAHHEFSFLGDKLYNRKEIDHLGPYENIRVAEDPREPSIYEPDFIAR